VISKADILERAREWQLTPEVVERDHVLGWLLAGIGQHPATKNNWVFKGGTCLKKCVLETYRFSEDLDFTLLPGAEYSEAGVDAVLREMVVQVTKLSGIRFPAVSGIAKDQARPHAARTGVEAAGAESGIPPVSRSSAERACRDDVRDRRTRRRKNAGALRTHETARSLRRGIARSHYLLRR